MIRHLALISVLFATPALAIDQAYLGSWAPSASLCLREDNSAFEITKKGFEGREEFCTTKQAKKAGTSWHLQVLCNSEGTASHETLSWKLLPNGHLHEVQNGRIRDYVRCPGLHFSGGK